VFKSELALQAIHSLKIKLLKNDKNINHEYVQIVSFARLVFVFIIQLLFDLNIRFNKNIAEKFIIFESEFDSQESAEVRNKLLSLEYVRSKIDSKSRISKKIIFIYND
jgi:hypothetical protein